MTISEISIKRPVLTLVMAITIVIFGGVSFMALGVREYPSVDPPIITVRTDFIGASAQIIESQITEPLEEQINRVDGIKNISSVSSVGRSTITVEFELSKDLDNAANDVRDMVSQAIRSLPPDVDPPVVSKANADAQTILAITLQSRNRSLLELTELAENVFEERLQTIDGVSQVYIWGNKQYTMRLILDIHKMNAYGITTAEIKSALNEQNVELPSGQIEGDRRYLTLQTYGRINTVDEFNNLIIKQKDNTIIRLSDVGKAELGALNDQSILRGNGALPMVGVALQPQPGANYIDIVDEAYKRVERLKREIPDDITVGVGLDVTNSIRNSISEVQSTILLSFCLVLFIIFIFLRNFRTTFIPVITIPISLIGGFIFLYASGFSINVLTLLGLLLATGLVVDDAIVMMENIYSKIEKGMDPIQAAFKGSKQVFFAIISTTVTLVAVFLPIFFIMGFTGRLFREFAMVVSGSIIISTFISLTLTVMISSRILKPGTKEYRSLRFIQKPIDFLLTHYEGWLRGFMRFRVVAIMALVITSALIVLFFKLLPSELAPLDDKGRLRIITKTPEGTSYKVMDSYQLKLLGVLDSIPEKEYLLSVTSPGFGSSVSVNSGFFRIMLKPVEERERSQMEVAESVSKMLRPYNMGQAIVVQEPTIEGSGGGMSGLPIQFVIQAPNLKKLEAIIPSFLEKARSNPAFDAVDIDLKFTKPELAIEIDRDRAIDLGISVRDISETLQLYFSEQRIGYFIRNGKQYFVLAKANAEQRSRPQEVLSVKVKASNGQMVALENLVTMYEHSLPPQLLRYNRYSSATISANPAKGYTLGQGIEAMDQIAAEVLDDNYLTTLSGNSADFAEGSGNLAWVFVFALILVYLTLAAQFESFRDPFTVMLTVPLALAGALMTLYFFGQTINIFSQIGMIVLVGIVTKNGILIVEFANQKRAEGLSLMEATIQASVDRLRPILMTSMATVLGAVPLVISFGGTANSRVPLGLVIIGGLIFSLALTLFIIPALYTFLTRKNTKPIIEEYE